MTIDPDSVIDFVEEEIAKIKPRAKKKEVKAANGDAKTELCGIQDQGELPPHAEDSIALAFAERYQHELRYVHKWGQWLRYDTSHWSFDETRHVFDLIRNLCREIAVSADKPISSIATAKTVAAVQRLTEADR